MAEKMTMPFRLLTSTVEKAKGQARQRGLSVETFINVTLARVLADNEAAPPPAPLARRRSRCAS